MVLTSSNVLIRPSALTIKASSPSFIRPAPSLLLFLSSVVINFSILIPLADNLVLSGTTSKLLTKPPKELTSATPGTVRSAGRITQSSKSRRSIKLKSPPSTANINISPKGVVIGAMPPSTPFGKLPHIAFKRSATCCLAQ